MRVTGPVLALKFDSLYFCFFQWIPTAGIFCLFFRAQMLRASKLRFFVVLLFDETGVFCPEPFFLEATMRK